MICKTRLDKMSKTNKLKKYIALIGILFLFPLLWILIFGVGAKHNFNTLKFFQPGSETALDSSSYTIPDFSFKDENGQVFTLDSMKGKVCMAAFYDLGDSHIKDITDRLLTINFKYRSEPDIVIVVFSTDSDSDRQKDLKSYIESNVRYNDFPNKWKYLTGDPGEMEKYLKEGFFIEDISKEARFRLIDPNGAIRGMYGNTEYHLQYAKDDIAILKKELDKKAYNERKAKEKR